ncbi:methyltransferase domain-containing protein [Nocardioides sp. CBS4Y-1]|uniref:Methyltransferase domain-containing protein n=2 Tax=Nocardioides acrostichi TaxID=2784339 RepID=A0A930UZ66_9ACTN|nr:methyltransferase domain-containing protein [Nocardioides acrostichi]
MIRLWDAEAATFDDAADHGLHDPRVRHAWRDLLARLLPPTPARVADLGCGTGTLTHLLGEEGYAVDGIDFSPEMVALALAKTSGQLLVTVQEGDAYDPPLAPAHYDVVMSRHVLWALPDPVEAIRRWRGLVRGDGRLVLVEGNWTTGAGLTAEQTAAAAREVGLTPTVFRLDDPALWGGPISDERYAVVC